MATMVSDDGLRDTKPSDDTIEYEKLYIFSSIIKCRHHLDPFSEIIHSYNNVSMPPDQVRVTCHEVDAPFSEWTNENYWIKRIKV
jgi:hypothetical protein